MGAQNHGGTGRGVVCKQRLGRKSYTLGRAPHDEAFYDLRHCPRRHARQNSRRIFGREYSPLVLHACTSTAPGTEVHKVGTYKIDSEAFSIFKILWIALLGTANNISSHTEIYIMAKTITNI